MLAEANPKFKPRMQNIIQESEELKLILSAIVDNLINPKGGN
jgi:hypothetical protein